MDRKHKIMIIVGVTGSLLAVTLLVVIGFFAEDIYGSTVTNKDENFDCEKCLHKHCQPYYDRTKNITVLTKSLCKDVFKVKECSCTGVCYPCGSVNTDCGTTLPPGITEDIYCDQFPDN